MKVRLGFVSNSSSASYTITVDADPEKFFHWLRLSKSEISFFEPSAFLCDIEENIEQSKKNMECDWAVKNDDFAKTWKEQMEKRISELEALKERVPKLNDDELITEILLYNGVRLHTEEDKVMLHYWTSMHNSFTEALPMVLQEILLLFLFSSMKVSAVFDSDN